MATEGGDTQRERRPSQLTNRALITHIAILLAGSTGGGVLSNGLFGGQLAKDVQELNRQVIELKVRLESQSETFRDIRDELRDLKKRMADKGVVNKLALDASTLAGEHYTSIKD